MPEWHFSGVSLGNALLISARLSQKTLNPFRHILKPGVPVVEDSSWFFNLSAVLTCRPPNKFGLWVDPFSSWNHISRNDGKTFNSQNYSLFRCEHWQCHKKICSKKEEKSSYPYFPKVSTSNLWLLCCFLLSNSLKPSNHISFGFLCQILWNEDCRQPFPVRPSEDKWVLFFQIIFPSNLKIHGLSC